MLHLSGEHLNSWLLPFSRRLSLIGDSMVHNLDARPEKCYYALFFLLGIDAKKLIKHLHCENSTNVLLPKLECTGTPGDTPLPLLELAVDAELKYPPL